MTALLRMSAGLIVWAAAFCILYALHGVGCARGWGPDGTQRFVLLAAWTGCICAGIAIAVWLRPGREGVLIERTAWRVAAIGAAATVVTGLPILVMPACL